ncbi:hypothetical protein [Confluentibacter sediminis]|uniref:hypothetical protein n=1 Tax=Confluentibacter sediminis TaxID=2219045 RepID=UPI000DABE9F5|nr:hypothetical protein [Confluentibacter sediminis]
MDINENRTDEKFELTYKPESSTFSGNQLKIIPTKPNYEPSTEQQKEVIKYLATEFSENEIRSILMKNIEFIDSGENFESVRCNHCGQKIEIENWQEAMDKAYQNSFADLTFLTPCCHKQTCLNDLEYEMPSGFSKYIIELINPNIKDNQKADLIKNLNEILGQDMELIWAHY